MGFIIFFLVYITYLFVLWKILVKIRIKPRSARYFFEHLRKHYSGIVSEDEWENKTILHPMYDWPYVRLLYIKNCKIEKIKHLRYNKNCIFFMLPPYDYDMQDVAGLIDDASVNDALPNALLPPNEVSEGEVTFLNDIKFKYSSALYDVRFENGKFFYAPQTPCVKDEEMKRVKYGDLCAFYFAKRFFPQFTVPLRNSEEYNLIVDCLKWKCKSSDDRSPVPYYYAEAEEKSI